MNILITGGAGYIGSHICFLLAEQGNKVTVLDSYLNSKKSMQTVLENAFPGLIRCIEGDVRDTRLVEKILLNQDIQYVIHLAGLKSIGESLAIPLEYYDVNLAGTMSLLKAMNEANVKKLIFSSSASVYGVPEYLPIDELHPIKPLNPYSKSKAYVEDLLRDLASSDDTWRIASLRYFNPVGAHESGLIGEDPAAPPSNLMPCIARVALAADTSLSIFGDNYETHDGTGVRDYIHIMDLAEGHLAAIAYLNSTDNIFEAINLGCGVGYSVLDVVKAYEEVTNTPIGFKLLDRRAGDVDSCYAMVDKARKLLFWKAKRSLSDMCISSHKWQLNSKI